MTLLHPLWLLLLPVLALPIWWHRKKQRSQKQDSLATAQFLPPANPELLRIWRWRDHLLLLLRCILLLALIAFLASLVVAQKGDTILIDASLKSPEEQQWIEREILDNKMASASRQTFCRRVECDIASDSLLSWLVTNQAQWHAKSRILVLAKDSNLPAPAQQSAMRLDVLIRTSYDRTKLPIHIHQITVHSKRFSEWRRLFSAYESVGNHRYEVRDKPQEKTELVVWDDDAMAPADWHAPLWWRRSLQNFDQSKAAIKTISNNIQQVETTGGRAWIINPLDAALDDIRVAKALFESWQKTQSDYGDLPSLSQDFIHTESNLSATPNRRDQEKMQTDILLLIIALFIAERTVTHARRR